MGSIETYLVEYGGTAFAQMPLNDVDLLIFAQLSYCDFLSARPGMLLSEAVRTVLETPRSADDSEQRFAFQQADDRRLLELTMGCMRYRDIWFLQFERKQSDDVQFAALALRADGLNIAVYRGTDNTLAGWKEDLDLTYRMPVMAQSYALGFLQSLAQMGGYPLIACGHSKGGNLAVYAALHAAEQVRSRVKRVVSFDGPGLREEVLSAFESDGRYAEILSRIQVILPEDSIVGVLFPQPGAIRIVDSRYVSVLQHYPYNWVVEGADFVDSRHTIFSRATAITMDRFLEQLSLDERERVITVLYEIVRATNAHTLQDILRGWIKNTVPVARAILEKLDSENVKLYLKVITSFFRALGETAGVLIGGEDITDAKGMDHT